jgi:hypothetical protein
MSLASNAIHVGSITLVAEPEEGPAYYRFWQRKVFLRENELPPPSDTTRKAARLADSLLYLELRGIDCTTPQVRTLQWSLRSSDGKLSGTGQPADSSWKLISPESEERREWTTACEVSRAHAAAARTRGKAVRNRKP